MLEMHTDLAIEAKESFPGDGGEIPGVALDVHYEEEAHMQVTCVEIFNQQGAKAMKKAMGTYITLEADFRDYEEACCEVLANAIRRLLPQNKERILVVGLGNKELTADSLGPITVSHLWITGHLIEEGVKVSCIAPGVMAQTGMETAQIVEGIVKEVKPDVVIVIDSLAARSTERLGKTIQLTDTGIHPGSGVGNHRKGLNQETLGIPVIAIGVPTVVGAATIACDTLSGVVAFLNQWKETEEIAKTLKNLKQQEVYAFIKENLSPQFSSFYVTPKDIDETMLHLGGFIAQGINDAVYGYGK